MSTRVLATDFGGPEVLSIVEQQVPAPEPTQVRIAVRAAGINRADVKSYSGEWGTDRAALPKALGFEAAGVVSAAGNDSGYHEGDEVVAFQVTGAYTTDLVADAAAVLPKPAGLDWQDAAGLLLTGATAVHTLTATDVHDGDTVLVHGGAGGVGLMAVQLAQLRGAQVIATAGARNHDLLRELGAVPVQYGDGLLERVRALAADGVDVALDLVGTDEAMDVSLALVEDRGRIATIANFERGPAEGVKVLGSGPGGEAGHEIRMGARGELLELAGSGRLRVLVDSTFPLSEAAEAHRRVLSGHTTGKVVLTT